MGIGSEFTYIVASRQAGFIKLSLLGRWIELRWHSKLFSERHGMTTALVDFGKYRIFCGRGDLSGKQASET